MPESEARFDALLLRLYRGSTELAFARFQHWALEQMQTVVRFDAACWGKGNPITRQILSVNLLNADPSMIGDYARIQAHDRFRDAMVARPGRTVILSDLMPRAIYEQSLLYTRFGRKHRMESMMGTVLVEPASGLLNVITVWRFDSRWPFSDSDRMLAERLTPHLIEANRVSRLASLQAWPMAGVPEDAERPWALVNASDGGLLEVNAAFVALVRREWPNWENGQLPAALRRNLQHSVDYSGREITISIKADNENRLLVPRLRHAAERLGTRESLVLQHYASGSSYRDIAQALGTSPATVRNQLARIYRRLGVHNKAELVQALHAMQRESNGG